MKKLILFFIVALFLTACEKKKDNHFTVTNIQIEPRFFENRMFNLMGLVDSVHYIKLESNDNCMVGNIRKIKIINDTIYLGDLKNTKGIYAFSISGKFLYKILNIGKGPGEYVDPVDFDVLDKNIVVYDDKLCKLLLYNKSGVFESERPLKGFLGTSFTSLPDNRLAFNSCGVEKTTHEIQITDINGKIMDKHFRIESWMKKILYINPECFPTAGSDHFFIPTHNDTIYKFKGTEPLPYIHIDFGTLSVNKSNITEKSKETDKPFITIDDFASIRGFYGTDSFSFVSFTYKKDGKLALIKNPNILIIAGSGFICSEDLDFLSYSPCASYKNKFVSIIYPNEILSLLKNANLKKTKIYHQLGKQLLNFKDIDNPVIVLYSIKNRNLNPGKKI